MKTSNLTYSVWGIFNIEDKFYLESLKKKMQKELKGPRFPIHFTVSPHFLGKENEIINKLSYISKKIKNFHIYTNNYGFKKKFFQSIFVKVNLTNDLKNNKAVIDNYLNIKKKYFFPHISLFYGNLKKEQKKNYIKNFKNFKKKIKVRMLCLVENDEKNLKWKIIKKFKIK